ncbi:hypothetical protein PSN45_002506 [Yamadazyma tenuis]|uniref:uncharacterized protein n=1 Tax=Candida tenuis TaxID=2315449 RepID=UPI00279BFEBC|nr:hypothetical protein PSN45_002506 [Yamadazyma tenuis]
MLCYYAGKTFKDVVLDSLHQLEAESKKTGQIVVFDPELYDNVLMNQSFSPGVIGTIDRIEVNLVSQTSDLTHLVRQYVSHDTLSLVVIYGVLDTFVDCASTLNFLFYLMKRLEQTGISVIFGDSRNHLDSWMVNFASQTNDLAIYETQHDNTVPVRMIVQKWAFIET